MLQAERPLFLPQLVNELLRESIAPMSALGIWSIWKRSRVMYLVRLDMCPKVYTQILYSI